jgi:hypothetical protein
MGETCVGFACLQRCWLAEWRCRSRMSAGLHALTWKRLCDAIMPCMHTWLPPAACPCECMERARRTQGVELAWVVHDQRVVLPGAALAQQLLCEAQMVLGEGDEHDQVKSARLAHEAVVCVELPCVPVIRECFW